MGIVQNEHWDYPKCLRLSLLSETMVVPVHTSGPWYLHAGTCLSHEDPTEMPPKRALLVLNLGTPTLSDETWLVLLRWLRSKKTKLLADQTRLKVMCVALFSSSLGRTGQCGSFQKVSKRDLNVLTLSCIVKLDKESMPVCTEHTNVTFVQLCCARNRTNMTSRTLDFNHLWVASGRHCWST